jgi:peptidyl-prolyl cis-trans isomerase D
MSVLESIRNKSGLAITVVGGALILFVISDMLQSNGYLFGGGSDNSLGEINGDKIDIKYFESKVKENEGFYRQRQEDPTKPIDQNTIETLREQTWQQIVGEVIMQNEYKEVGITVSIDELRDMVQGENIHPQIQSAPIFQNQQTGQFDRSLVTRFFQNLMESTDENAKQQWAMFEKGIKQEAEAKKYAALISKAIYATNLEGKAKMQARTQTADYNMIALIFNTIADSTIAEDESALKSYFNKNSKKYLAKDNLRKIDFVLFDITPTGQDTANIEKWVAEKTGEFASATNDTLFVDLNSDTKFDTVAHNLSFYPEAIRGQLFNSPVGAIVGPMFDNGSFKIYKVSGIKEGQSYNMRASHILFKTDGPTKQDTLNTMKKAQEVLAEIRRGADFGEKAAQYGTDGTASQGGDLGWFTEGQMVKEFNDYVLKGNKGDMSIVKTQFGIHIVKITEAKTKKLVCAGVLERKLEAGEQTTNSVYNQASQFAAAVSGDEAFETSAANLGLTKRQSDNIRENDKVLAGMQDAREVVRWAYNAKLNDVSEVFTVGSNFYIVAKLTGISEKGKADFETVKEKVLADYRKERKAEMLIEKAQNAITANSSDINKLAADLQSFVVPTTTQTFEAANVAYIGVDNLFIGTLFGTKEKSKILGPVKGDNAVYIYVLNNISEGDNVTDYTDYKNEIRTQNAQRLEYGSFDLLKELYGTKDNRYKFY